MSQRQPSSDGFGIARPTGPEDESFVGGPPLTRYDLLLVTIPLVLLLGWVAGQFTGAPLWATLAAGALSLLPLLADGLAVNPPR